MPFFPRYQKYLLKNKFEKNFGEVLDPFDLPDERNS